MTKLMALPLLVPVIWLSLEVRVHAYLDPGTGSMLLQVLLGGFAALGVVARLYWRQITSLVRRKGSVDRDDR